MTEQDGIDLISVLGEIRQSLALIAGAMASAPDIREPIQNYSTFDWSSIGAEVLRNDQDGPSVVRWNGKIFKRRSPSNKFAPSIWFSRCVGKAEDGANLYETLISFDIISDDVEPVNPKARALAFANATKSDGLNDLRPNLEALAERLYREGRVTKTGASYSVKPNGPVTYSVTRGASGNAICNCERYEAGSASDPKFRCEHVLAVKLFAAQAEREASRKAA